MTPSDFEKQQQAMDDFFSDHSFDEEPDRNEQLESDPDADADEDGTADEEVSVTEEA